MVSQNSTKNNSEKLSSPTPPTPIPDSISIPAVSISTPSQISRDEPTIAAEEIGKSTNNKEPSSDKNKKNLKKNFHCYSFFVQIYCRFCSLHQN